MDTTILEELGLTNAEIKIYLSLLGLGISTAGPIIEKTGLQNSVVHLTLRKLTEKGYISYIKKGGVKNYRATDPKNIIKFIEEKKERYQKILPELLIKMKKQERSDVEIYEGFKGFKTALFDYIEGAKKGDEYLFFSFYPKNPEEYKNIFNYYKEFDKERKSRGIITKGLVPISIKESVAKRKIPEIKLVNFPIPTNISIFNERVMFTPWEEKPLTIIVYSRQLADSFREYFYSIWNSIPDKQIRT